VTTNPKPQNVPLPSCAAALPAVSLSNPSKAPADPRVLVVEDEARMRELLQRVLTNWGFDVVVARSAEEATRLVEARDPDVVVLDLNLPGEGGIEFFSKLRARLPRVQGIVLTGFASIDSAREAIHLDVVEFLTKPCHLGELEQALDRAMRRLAPLGKPALAFHELAGDDSAQRRGELIDNDANAGRTLEEIEREHILATLQRNDGNRTAAAAELGISRRTLYYKLDGYQRDGHLS
jgi:two-component system response regulator PrrA